MSTPRKHCDKHSQVRFTFHQMLMLLQSNNVTQRNASLSSEMYEVQALYTACGLSILITFPQKFKYRYCNFCDNCSADLGEPQ